MKYPFKNLFKKLFKRVKDGIDAGGIRSPELNHERPNFGSSTTRQCWPANRIFLKGWRERLFSVSTLSSIFRRTPTGVWRASYQDEDVGDVIMPLGAVEVNTVPQTTVTSKTPWQERVLVQWTRLYGLRLAPDIRQESIIKSFKWSWFQEHPHHDAFSTCRVRSVLYPRAWIFCVKSSLALVWCLGSWTIQMSLFVTFTRENKSTALLFSHNVLLPW